MGFLSRKPTSDDPPEKCKDNLWGGDECYDDTCLLLNGLAKRCSRCKRVIRIEYLIKQDTQDFCPDCAAKTGAISPSEYKHKKDGCILRRTRNSGDGGGFDGEAD